MNLFIKLTLPFCLAFNTSPHLQGEVSQSVSDASTVERFTTSDLQTNESVEVRLDRYLKKVTSDLNFSGTVLVAQQNQIVFHNGYGWADLKKTTPVLRNTKFYIASISKQFTAAAILKLEEQNRLNVNDSIGKYFKDVPPDKASITIHQLLTHTSGLGQNYAADRIADLEEAVKAILKAPLNSPVGERFGYTNDGYNLLAAIVQIASGQSFESFLRKHILKPAGMSESGFWGETPSKSELPIADTIRDINPRTPNWGFRGATGMYSTTGDLHKWCRALFANNVLKKTAREKLLTPYVSTSRGSYTYGWFVSRGARGREEIWTAGSEDFGHNAIIKTYPDGTVIVVASNAGNISGVPARSVVIDELARIVMDAGTE
jgi:CubicO group peptidase (beta-lactamase class C family)